MTDRDFPPRLEVLPPPQRLLWDELSLTPKNFTLYDGTALALHLGHRISVDFDFFSNQSFDPERLLRDIGYLHEAEPIQLEADTLTCRVDRGGPVLVSFFGGLSLGRVLPCELAPETGLAVASLLDIAGTKAAVVQKRAQAKDYIDIDALLGHGIDLPTMLAAASAIYGRAFNPLITLKTLNYFGDVPKLPATVGDRLAAAVAAVDPTHLPVLIPHERRPV
jgi:hypothetical protein